METLVLQMQPVFLEVSGVYVVVNIKQEFTQRQTTGSALLKHRIIPHGQPQTFLSSSQAVRSTNTTVVSPQEVKFHGM